MLSILFSISFRSHSGIIGAIDWHAYSQLILRPLGELPLALDCKYCHLIYVGWTTAATPDEAQLKSIGDEMSDRIFEVHHKIYTSQRSVDLYPTTGAASDWYRKIVL